MKIGLSLSGGGVRATVFHLGVLTRLAASERWGEINFISTVSGGSLCTALVFENAGQRWPTSGQFQANCLPEIRKVLTSYDLEKHYKWGLSLRPWLLLGGRASLIGRLIRDNWGVRASVAQMPDLPRWEVCATCYETGKNWRFSKRRMGDYLTHYVVSPDFPLADAVAASAAVPGLIGPLTLETGRFIWHRFPKDGTEPTIEVKPIAPHLTLWDGGVYDNLGTEPIFKPQRGLRDEVDFLITSDASKPLAMEFRRFQWGLPPYLPPFRLINVATDQVRGLRLRSLIGFHIENPNSGVVIRMGNTTAAILKAAKRELPQSWEGRSFLSESEVKKAAGLETSLRKLSEEEFDRLLKHGYEVADATLYAYVCSDF